MQRHGLLKSSQLLVQQEYSLVLGDVMLPDSVFPVQSEGMFSQIQSTEYGITNYTEGEFTFTRGHKQYELSNHLGNVLVTIQDRKWGRQTTTQTPPQTNCDYYLSYVVTITDYHAFGSTITERSASFGGGYRFGFGGQNVENDGTSFNVLYEERTYNPQLVRWSSLDGAANLYPGISPYVYVGNSPNFLVEKDGNFIGTLIGAAIGGYRAIKTGKPFWKEVGKGALSGLAADVTAGVILLSGGTATPLLLGAAGVGAGFSGNLTDQLLDDRPGVDKWELLIATGSGGGLGYFGGKAAPYISKYISKIIRGKRKTSSVSVGEVKEVIPEEVAIQSRVLDKADPEVLPIQNIEIGSPPKPNDVPEIGLFKGKMGGRLGNVETRRQVDNIAKTLESKGYTITGGGLRRAEEYLPPLSGGRKGGSYIDITETHPNYPTLRINTVDVNKSGLPTLRELNNAARIRKQIQPGEHLLTIPKK